MTQKKQQNKVIAPSLGQNARNDAFGNYRQLCSDSLHLSDDSFHTRTATQTFANLEFFKRK